MSIGASHNDHWDVSATLSEKLQNVMAVTDFLALFWQETGRPEHGSNLPGDSHGKEIDVCCLRLSALACRTRRWRRSHDRLRLALNCLASDLAECVDYNPGVEILSRVSH